MQVGDSTTKQHTSVNAKKNLEAKLNLLK